MDGVGSAQPKASKGGKQSEVTKPSSTSATTFASAEALRAGVAKHAATAMQRAHVLLVCSSTTCRPVSCDLHVATQLQATNLPMCQGEPWALTHENLGI